MKTRRVITSLVLLLLVAGIMVMWHVVQVSATYGCLTGGDHAGAAWDPATDCPGGIAGNHFNIGALTIGSGETATVFAYNGTQYGSVQITASSASIAGTLTANGAGYTGGNSCCGTGGGSGGSAGNNGGVVGGASYGGQGGLGTPPSSYGSMTAPTSLGSGGGGSNGGPGGNGGGAIQLTITGTTTVSGTITAAGGPTTGDSGAGSGGSIYITTGTLAGSGSITAPGGNGSSNCCGQGGNGGGGRIYVSYSSSNTYSGSLAASPGSTGGYGGEPGTALLVDSANNDLYIQTNNTWKAQDGASYTYRNITVMNNATWTQKGYYTTNTNGIGITFAATNFTVASGSTVNLAGWGYLGGQGNSATGAGPGGATGSNGGTISGASYAGLGGLATPPSTYGSMTAPLDLGSGGGGSNGGFGGNGGGAIRLTVSGTTTISGSINANGGPTIGDSGAGSGGSIYITSGTLTGAGSLTVNGGNGGSNCCGTGGNGGGGRMYVSYSAANTYTGIFTASPGSTGGYGGEPGTALLVDSANNDLYIITNNTWKAQDGSSYTYRNVSVSNNATWTQKGYYTTNTNGVGIAFTVTNFSVTTGATISMVGAGYGGGNGNGVTGSGPGGAAGSNGGTVSGASYGGQGGLATPPPAYGSASAPVDLGSGGGGSNGGNGAGGGGALRVTASNAVTINGTVNANGGPTIGDSGAGSGGSIYLTTSTIAGVGSISANGGNGGSNCCGVGGNGGGGRIAIYYRTTSGYAATVTAAAGATPGDGGSSGTVVFQLQQVNSHPRSVEMSDASPSASNVAYQVTFTPLTSVANPDVVVDFCANTPDVGGSCTATAGTDVPNFSAASAGGSWTLTTIGSNRGVKLTTSTVSLTAGTPATITLTGVANPSVTGSFYARILTYKTGTAGSSTSDAPGPWIDSGGAALSTVAQIKITAVVEETLTFCVSSAPITDCSTTSPPSLVIGHAVGGNTILDGSAVDTKALYTQASTNAQQGIIVRLRDVGSTSCGGLSTDGGVSCTIPAAGAVATTLTAGTAAIGLCVTPGSANTTALAPYNTAGCTKYGLDDGSGTSVLTTGGSPLFSSSGVLNAETDTLTWAATAANVTPAGTYTAHYSLVATGTY